MLQKVCHEWLLDTETDMSRLLRAVATRSSSSCSEAACWTAVTAAWNAVSLESFALPNSCTQVSNSFARQLPCQFPVCANSKITAVGYHAATAAAAAHVTAYARTDKERLVR